MKEGLHKCKTTRKTKHKKDTIAKNMKYLGKIRYGPVLTGLLQVLGPRGKTTADFREKNSRWDEDNLPLVVLYF